jgi:hypothetical protein
MPISFKNQTIKTTRRKMKKAILAVLSGLLLVSTTQAVHAEDQKVLAIIDTAIDSSKFPAVIYEACFTTSTTTGCPNKQTFMEGKGAASATWPKDLNSPTYHGDSMVKSALTVNPNVKILFVRYSDVSQLGNSLNTPEALVKAIDWVSKNADKYSVDAVSISQSSISTTNLAKCTSDTQTINAIASLNAKNIPTFAATGNDGSLTQIGFPSCIPGITAIAALATDTAFEKLSNKGPGVDGVAIGKTSVTKYNGYAVDIYGTSPATVKSASSYLIKDNYTSFASYLGSLSKVSVAGISYIFTSK